MWLEPSGPSSKNLDSLDASGFYAPRSGLLGTRGFVIRCRQLHNARLDPVRRLRHCPQPCARPPTHPDPLGLGPFC